MEPSLVIDENDRKSLECPICKDLLSKPKLTRCGHVFCESCLNDYLERNECNCPPCPVCRERIVLPQSGMQGFRTEHFYQSVVERLKKQDELVENMNTGICGLCKETSELISKCLTCACVICKQCMPSHNVLKPHCTIVAFSEIENVDLDELMSQRKIVCESHDTELANLYCHDCNKIICLICKVTEPGHSDHKCEHINERGSFCRKYLEDLQEKIAKLIEDATAASRNVTTILSDFLRDLQNVTNKGNNTIDMLIAELNRKRETFLNDICEKRNEYIKRLRLQKDKVENVKTEGQTLMKELKKALTYGTDGDVATFPNVLNQKIESLKRDLNSSLHKDFRIKVDFHQNKVDGLKRQLSKYNIGKIEYSQNVAFKAWEEISVYHCCKTISFSAKKCTNVIPMHVLIHQINCNEFCSMVNDKCNDRDIFGGKCKRIDHCMVDNKINGACSSRITFLIKSSFLHNTVRSVCFYNADSLIFLYGPSENNKIMQRNNKTLINEQFILPSFPNAQILQPQDAFQQCDGLLYITQAKSGKVATVSYLP